MHSEQHPTPGPDARGLMQQLRFGFAETSQVERNKAMARRIFDDLFNRADESWLHTELFGPDFSLYSPTLDEPGGPEDVKEFVRDLHGGFPDFHVQIEDLIAEKDKVAVRWRTTNQTHAGWYRGVPPTGRQLTMTGVHIFRFADGRLRETWLEIDALGGVQQMGILPPEGISTFGRVRFMLAALVRLAFLEARSGRSKPKAKSTRNDGVPPGLTAKAVTPATAQGRNRVP